VVRKQTRDLAVRRRGMRLHVAACAAGMVLETPPRGGEGIADCHIDVLMRMVERMAMADHQLLARRPKIDMML